MVNQKLYIETPISVKPEVAGTYMMFKNGKYMYESMWHPKDYGQQFDGWFMYNNPKTITHWLRPVSKEEYDREIAEKAWQDGFDNAVTRLKQVIKQIKEEVYL